MKKKNCSVCHQDYPSSELTNGGLVNEGVFETIKKHNVDFDENSYICLKDLNRFRSEYMKTIILRDVGEIEELEQEVIKSLEKHELLSEDLNKAFSETFSFADKLSDKLAEFGGSWKFIIAFGSILGIWILINTVSLLKTPFDPYPYILLNLVLSCLAAIQAPIIMMSQNRQEAKDRLRAELDYKINLKAELEIRHLKSKLDQLSSHQWRRLLEIQEFQTELIEDLTEKILKIK